MSGALPVHVTLRAFFGAAYSGLPYSTSTGSTLPLTIEARNTLTGQLVDASGLRVREDRPDGADVTLDGNEIGRITQGRYAAEIFVGPPGDWTFHVDCEEPRPAEAKAWLRASGPPVTENTIGTGAAVIAAPGNRPLEMTLFRDVGDAAPLTGAEGLLVGQEDEAGVTQPRFVKVDVIRQDALDTIAPKVEQVSDDAQAVEMSRAEVAGKAEEVAQGLAVLGAGSLRLSIPTPTALTTADHSARWLVLTGTGFNLSLNWADTGDGFSCTITNLSTYWCRPTLSGFTEALLRGADLGIRPGGTATLFCVASGSDRLAFLTGDTA